MQLVLVFASVSVAVRPGWDDHLDVPEYHHHHPHPARGRNALQSVQVVTSAHAIRQPSLSHEAASTSLHPGIPSNDTLQNADKNLTDATASNQGLTFLQESQSTEKSSEAEQVGTTFASADFVDDKENQELERGKTSESTDGIASDDGEEDGESLAGEVGHNASKTYFARMLGDAMAVLSQIPKVHALSGQGDNGERAVSLGMWLLALFSIIGGFAVSARLYSFCYRNESTILNGCFARSKATASFVESRSMRVPFEAEKANCLDSWVDLGSHSFLEWFSIDRSTVADQVLLVQRLFPELLQHVSNSLDRTPSPDTCNWTAKSLADVFLFLGLHPDALKTGLSSSEASRRLALYGRNDLEVGRLGSLLQVFLHALLSKTSCLVLISAVVAFVLMDILTGILLMSCVLLGALVFALFERNQSCSSLALAESQALQARCLRDKQWLWLPTSEIVPGDIVRVVAGECAFADLRIIAAEGLWIDESLLRVHGSDKVEKHGRMEPLDQMGGLAENIIYAHTDIISGSAIAVAVETGVKTRIGKVFKSLSHTGGIASAVVRMMLGSSLWHGLISLGGPLIVACLLVNFVSFFISGMFLSRDPDAPCSLDNRWCKYLRAVQTAMLVAAKLIPQALPLLCGMCFTVSLNGFRDRGVVVRKASAMRSLGTCSAICSDMSKMLTHGCLTSVSLFSSLPEPHTFEFDEEVNAESGRSIYLLDRSQRPRRIDEDLNQPDLGMATREAKFESPILALAQQCNLKTSGLWEEFPVVMEVPFNPDIKLRVTVHAVPTGAHSLSSCMPGTSYLAVFKGAPEKLLPRLTRGLSHKDRTGSWEICSRDPELLQGLVESQNLRFASAALRVLLCAMLPLTEKELSDLQCIQDAAAQLESLLQDLVFVSLLTFRDPLKEQVRPSIDACLLAGIRIVMVTGEQLATAQAIARAIGIPGKAQDAANLRLSCGAFRPSAEIIDLCSEVCIWARAQPEEKCEISKALKELEKVCVVIAGSINDVAVLRQADVGIALGSACSIARHAADVVLMDNSFACLVETIEGANQTSANLSKAVVFCLGINVGEFIAHMACVVLQLPTGFTIPNVMLGMPAVFLGALPLCWEPAEQECRLHGSRHRHTNFRLCRLQALVIWCILPMVIVGTLVVGLTLHVGVVKSHLILDLCDYAWHPEVDWPSTRGHSNHQWRVDEAPYHCRCPALSEEGVASEQWGRQQSQTNNIFGEFRKTSGSSGHAYAKDQGPFRDGIGHVLEACELQSDLPRNALCWKEQLVRSAPVVLADGTESANGEVRPLFHNLLLHEERNCARYGTRIAKTMAWFATILSEAFLLQSVRSPHSLYSTFWRNLKAVAGLCCVVVLALMAIYIPALQDTLQLAPLSAKSLLLASVGPFSAVVVAEISKAVLRRFVANEFSQEDKNLIDGQVRYI